VALPHGTPVGQQWQCQPTQIKVTPMALPPEVLVRQVERLGGDLRTLTGPVYEQARAVVSDPGWAAPGDLYLTGAGDSYHAGVAMEMAFRTIAGMPCQAVSAQRFSDYCAAALQLRRGHSIVVGASSSGRTPEVVAALRSARQHGARTVAVTGYPDSPVAQAAERSVVIALPDLERSPGIRTYAATLLAFLALALRMGARAGRADDNSVAELTRLADSVDATAVSVRDQCRAVADLIASAPVLTFAGGGPSFGTAKFSAAKMIEATGIASLAVDTGEWWHVERRALPADMPVFVIAPPGRSYQRTVLVAAAARQLGRRLIAVVDSEDALVAQHSSAILPVRGTVSEELSPLLYHVYAGYVASFAAQRLGRPLYADDPPSLPRTLDGFATLGHDDRNP
jgi:glucosamine--fructose-6-phosphate aminotransferase (isomerizing)